MTLSTLLSSILVSWGLLASDAQRAEEDMRRALEAGDYVAAWRATVEARTEDSARLQAELLFQAGDPSGALAAARRGLRTNPSDFELLYFAAGSALWLEEPEEAQSYAAQLEKAIEAPAGEGMLPPEGWRVTALEFRRQSADLARNAHARASALTRARALAVLGLLLTLGGIVALLARGYGRSSNPVS